MKGVVCGVVAEGGEWEGLRGRRKRPLGWAEGARWLGGLPVRG
jgi:hypothetical protein